MFTSFSLPSSCRQSGTSSPCPSFTSSFYSPALKRKDPAFALLSKKEEMEAIRISQELLVGVAMCQVVKVVPSGSGSCRVQGCASLCIFMGNEFRSAQIYWGSEWSGWVCVCMSWVVIYIQRLSTGLSAHATGGKCWVGKADTRGNGFLAFSLLGRTVQAHSHCAKRVQNRRPRGKKRLGEVP